MSLIEKLRADALHEVEAGGYEWRIRRVSAADLAAVKHVSLMVLSREALLPQKAPATPEEAVEQMKRQADKLPPEGLARLRAADVAMLKAAVVAARLPDGAWEPIRIVGAGEASDTEAGTLSVRDLPAGVESFLAEEATAWAVGGAEGVDALRAFRNGYAGDAQAPASAGEGVQRPALHAVAGGE